MQLFTNPYDTTLLKSVDRKKWEELLPKFTQRYKNNAFSVSDLDLYLMKEARADIDSLLMPYYLEKEDSLITDIRPFINKAGVVNNKTDVDLRISILTLTRLWMDNELAPFTSSLATAGVVFGFLIRRVLGSTYNIEGVTDVQVAALCADYYGHLINKDREEYQRQGMIDKLTNFPVKVTAPIVENAYQYKSFSHFLEIMKDHTGDPRLKKLNMAVVMRKMSNLYFGFRNKEVVMVAMEYPPVWTALVHHIGTNRGMNRSPVYPLYNRVNKNTREPFELAMTRLLQEVIGEMNTVEEKRKINVSGAVATGGPARHYG